MNYQRRLLILSCSQRKCPSQDLLPAIKRYNGPLFFVLRRFLRECPREVKQLDVYILSAAYGLIAGDFPTPLYDQKMNMARVVELQPQVKTTFSSLLQNNYASICFLLGKTYLKTFEGLLDLVPTFTESIVPYGPIGKKQTQLKRWLLQEHLHIFAERNFDMKIEVIDFSTQKAIETYSVPHLYKFDFQKWKDKSEVVINLDSLLDAVANLSLEDSEIQEPVPSRKAIDFYLPDSLKDLLLERLAQQQTEIEESASQFTDRLNEVLKNRFRDRH